MTDMDRWYGVTCLYFGGTTVSNQARSRSLCACWWKSSNQTGRNTGKRCQQTCRCIFHSEKGCLYWTGWSEKKKKKNSHSGDRKHKREYYASSPQEPHGTAGMFAKSTGSRLLARSPHRLGEVSVTVLTVSDIKKRTKPKNHQWVIRYQTCDAISTVHISHQSGRFLLSPSGPDGLRR